MYNLVSFLGLFLLIGFGWALSTDRKQVNWKTIAWGLGLQLLFAVFIFLFPIGAKLFLVLNDIVVNILNSSTEGVKFVFGRLALPPGTQNEYGEPSLGFFLAFQALPTIIFFASLMALLYHLGFLPWLINLFSRLFTRLMHISGAESLCAASNIFVGVESATTIRPYIERMTRSELCTALTAGMATIASSVMALYVFILQAKFPTIAGHLISASLLSAPAAVVMSKLLMPETGTPETLGQAIRDPYAREGSAMEALIKGANEGLKLVLGITTLLIAFVGLVGLADAALLWSGNHLGLGDKLMLSSLLGYVAYPFTLALGVPPVDAMAVARLIGERAVVTEVKAYQDLAVLISQGTLHHPRSIVITTYALCGFAHVASLAIFIGGFGALAPSRLRDLTDVGPRALLAATLACLMTAAVAGTFFTNSSILLGPQ